MAKQTGLGDAFLIGGWLISNDVNSIGKVSGGPKPWETTGIDKLASERIGLERDGGIDFVVFLNTTALIGANNYLKTLPLIDTLVTYCRSTTLGAPAAVCNAKEVDYAPTRGADGSLTFAVSSVANSYGVEWGYQATAGQRSDTTATNGTSVDDGAATAFGAQAYLQYQSVVGTSVTVAVQDSADNVTFANVTGLVFTTVNGGANPGFERLSISNVSTLRRYVRVATTGTFSSAVFQVTVVRNEIAGVVF